MNTTGTRLKGRYRLSRRLGRGGQGAVYAAHDEHLNRTVAVKLLPATFDTEQFGRFEREARVLARIKHPNVVTVFDFDWHDGRAFVVMEHLAGPDLARVLRDQGRLSVEWTLRYGLPVADALASLHGAAVPVVHRDLKPPNLVLDGAGTIKICDFGLAVLPDSSMPRLTAPGVRMGTLAYMAPEQYRGDEPSTPTDVYAFGAVLHALLTGGPPFGTVGSYADFAHRVQHTEPEPVTVRCPDAPAELARLVRDMLAKDPSARPTARRAREVLAGLFPKSAALGAQPADPGAQTADPETQPADPGAERVDPGAEQVDPHAETVDAEAETVDAARELDQERAIVTGLRPPAGATGPDSGSGSGSDSRVVTPGPGGGPDAGRGAEPGPLPELRHGARLLRQGAYAEADRHFTDLAHRLRAAGRDDDPSAFAAEFGRIRSRLGLGEEAVAAMRLVRLVARATAALGLDHPLVREIRAFIDSRS